MLNILINFFLASQVWQLMNVFPFVIGAKISVGDPHYACFMLLCDIAKIPFLRLLTD